MCAQLVQPFNTFVINVNWRYNLVIILLAVVLFKYSNAQSIITFDAGQVVSTYKFTDEQGQEKGFSSNITGCFSIGYQKLSPNGLFLRTNVGMRKGGASLIYNEVKADWNVQYADASVGVGYMATKWRVKPYLSASPYFAYMLKAEQTIGSDTYDIKHNKSMVMNDYGVYISPGFKVALSNTIGFYAEYKQIIGLQNLENTAGQKSYNRGFSLNLGVAIAIVKYNYVTTK